MSPLEQWNQLATPDRLDLPLEPDELEIVCCNSTQRVISNEGIEWIGTMFQSSALQELRRRLPSSLGGRVTVRNDGHMARIWVYDPTDDSHLEVLNSDPNTKDLTVKQVSDLNVVRGSAKSPGRLTAAEGRKRLRDWQRQLVECKNKRTKKALMRLLGLFANDPGSEEGDTPADAGNGPAQEDTNSAPGPNASAKKPKRTAGSAQKRTRQQNVDRKDRPSGDTPAPVFGVKRTPAVSPNHGVNT